MTLPAAPPAAPRPRAAAIAVATVFLVATCLRPALTAVGPVLPQIGRDEGLGEAAQGVLGALPLLAFAVTSPFVHRLARRFGVERAVLGALLVLAVALAARSYGGVVALWLGTAVIGAAITVGNVLVPAIVKRDYADHVSAATGVYSAFLGTAASVASIVAAPLALAVDWRLALAVWVAPTLVVAAVWAPRVFRGTVVTASVTTASPPPSDAAGPSVWRQRKAWLLTGFMGLQSVTFYIMVTWLPTVEASFGVPARTAGVHLFVYQVVGIVSGLAIPLVMRTGLVRAAVLACTPMPVAVVGLLTAPGLVAVWAFVAGLGSGAALVVALALVGLRARDSAEAARLSGMTQSVGYLLAAAGPVVAGALAQWSGGWTLSLLLVLGLSTAQLVVGVGATRVRSPRPG